MLHARHDVMGNKVYTFVRRVINEYQWQKIDVEVLMQRNFRFSIILLFEWSRWLMIFISPRIYLLSYLLEISNIEVRQVRSSTAYLQIGISRLFLTLPNKMTWIFVLYSHAYRRSAFKRILCNFEKKIELKVDRLYAHALIKIHFLY